MQLFGVTFTLLTIVKSGLLLWLISIIFDWFKFLSWKRRFNLKGDFPFPFLGTLPYVLYYAYMGKDSAEVDNMKEKRYGSVVVSVIGSVKVIRVFDVELLKKIFIKDHVLFQNRFSIKQFEPWPIEKMLLSLKDAHWKRVRGIITPTFSAGKLKKMTGEINHCADLLATGLLEKAKTDGIVDSKKHFGCYTMDVIASTAFGIRTDSLNNPEDPFVSLAQKVFGLSELSPWILFVFLCLGLATLLTRLFGVSYFYPKDSMAFFTDVIKKIIQERREKGDKERTDMLQLMLNAELHGEPENGNQSDKKLSPDELLAQGFFFFIAGYETTATLMTFLSYALAMNPDVQEQLLQEIDGHIPTEMADIEYDVVMEMPYLDQVINETLRMYPPVVKMNRTTSHSEDVELDGHWFPRETSIQYSMWQIHHDPVFYPEPDTFRPERFTPEEKAKRDPFVFIPFGHGPRNCIGMRLALLEAKVATVSVLRKVKFVKCGETEEDIQLTKEIFLKPKSPVRVGVVLR